MLVSARMHKVRIIVLKRHTGALTEAVGRLGVLQLTETAGPAGPPADAAPPGGAAPPADAGQNEQRIQCCRELHSRLEALMDWLGVERPSTPTGSAGAAGAGSERISLEGIEALIRTVEARTETVGTRLDALAEETRRVQETIEQLAPYRELSVPPRELAETAFLNVVAGDIPDWQIPACRAALPADAILVPIGVAPRPEEAGAPDRYELRRALVLSSRRSRFAVQTILEDRQFRPSDLPAAYESAPAAIHEAATARRDELAREREIVQAPLRELGLELAPTLAGACRAASVEERVAEAEQSFGATWATAIMTGWCPADKVEAVRGEVERVTEGQGVFKSSEATAEDIEEGRVPTLAQQPRWLKPFGRLAHSMGKPTYRELEPTLLFAISFLLLFGLIFGDLGHGLCLLVIGLATYFKSKKPAVRDIGYVIAAAGISSALFGTFFQGAFFGKSLHDWGWPLTLALEPLRWTPGEDAAGAGVLRYLVIALVAGVVLISTGVIINIINCVRRGDLAGGLLGGFGVAGIVFYWGALALAVKLAVAGPGGADLWLAAGLIVVPLLLLALHEPIYALLTRRKKLWDGSPAIGLLEGLVEAFETVMTYLANTFSFLRVAAFALSHGALCLTIFVIQGMVKGPAAILWYPIVFVLGTVLIIALEGLIVAIQVCRLEYYEFFSKFFRGEGTRFKPFRLD